jgi:hypothetical protein
LPVARFQSRRFLIEYAGYLPMRCCPLDVEERRFSAASKGETDPRFSASGIGREYLLTAMTDNRHAACPSVTYLGIDASPNGG